MPSPSSLGSGATGGLPPEGEKHAEIGKTDRPGDAAQSGKESSREDSSDEWRVEPEPDRLDTEAPGVAGAVSRVLSRISTKSTLNPGPPPDGGKAAWIACKWIHGGTADGGRGVRSENKRG